MKPQTTLRHQKNCLVINFQHFWQLKSELLATEKWLQYFTKIFSICGSQIKHLKLMGYKWPTSFANSKKKDNEFLSRLNVLQSGIGS